jgi:hypothetical protein
MGYIQQMTTSSLESLTRVSIQCAFVYNTQAFTLSDKHQYPVTMEVTPHDL